MQCHVSFMQFHVSCILLSTNTFVRLVKRQYLYSCTNTQCKITGRKTNTKNTAAVNLLALLVQAYRY
jgi:hypothetical protein